MTSEHSLNIYEDLVLMLLNEQTGYFHQVEGWNLSCAIVGAVLGDLSLKSRIDTDETSLFLIDSAKTGEPVLDLFLEEIASHPDTRDTRYWIERLMPHSETIMDSTLENLTSREIITHHDGDFYTINHFASHEELQEYPSRKSLGRYVQSQIEEVIFTDVIPGPREALIIGILKACDVIHFIFELNEEQEEKINWVCKLELLTRTIVSSLEEIRQIPALQHRPLAKKIPKVPLGAFLSNRHVRDGNIPALFASMTSRFGPVFELRPPFQKPLLFLAGPKVNRWVHRNARLHMTSGNYFRKLEEACGAHALITSLDGADHFRLRKVMKNVYSEGKFSERLEDICRLIRQHMSSQQWQAGSEIKVKNDIRLMVNLQMTHLTVSTDTQDIFEDLVKWKERASNCYVGRLMPHFLARTPAMNRRFQLLNTFMGRIKQNHMPSNRAETARDLADEIFSLHGSDPQFLPEQNLGFMLAGAPILQSIYVGDLLGFAVFEIARNPELAVRIREEANALFDGGGPDRDKFSPENYDVTRRFLMECLRLYPVVSMQVRNVTNSCVVEDFSLPLGERVHIVQTASHYLEDVFPDPFKFDIDRYLPSRNEHLSPSYAPYGLGTHLCVGFSWLNLQMIVNLLLIVYHFELAPLPKDYKLRISPFPTLSVTNRLKLRIEKQLRDLQD